MATNWSEILKNAKFEDVDKDLNGIPSTLAASYKPEKYKERSAAAVDPRYQGTLAKIASTLSGVVRGGTFGLLDPMTKAVYPAGAKILEKSKAVNPKESAVGELVGTVGSAFTNPATAGKAGIGLLRAGIKGSKLLPTLARNAIMTGTAAVPQAAGELAQGEKAGTVAGNFAKSMATGTALGTATETLLGKLPNILSKLKKTATATAVREGLDIDPRSFKNAATIGGKIKGGTVRERAKGLGSDLIELMNKEGVRDEASKEAWLAAQKARWKDVDTAFDTAQEVFSGNNPNAKFIQNTLIDKINAHPQIQSVIEENPENGVKMVQELLDVSDKKKGIANIREYLQRQADLAYKPGATVELSEKARAAKAIRSVIDDAFVPPELKADYSKYRAIDDALTREDLRMPKTFSTGSQTAGRMIGSGLAGGVLGGSAGGVDTSDPNWLKKLALKSAGGFVAGSLVPRIGSAVANKLTGRLAARIAPLIPELGAKAGGEAGSLVSRLGARAIQPEEAATIASTGEEQPQTPTEAKTDQSIQEQEQTAQPENISAAKEATNSAWADTVRARLNTLYDTYLSDYSDEISREEFFRQADELTDHFDPRKTAGFIFTDKNEKENYLRSYDAALRFQGLQGQYQGKDFIGEALQPGKILGIPSGIGAKGTDEQIAYNQLRDWAVSLMTEKGKAPAKATIDQVSKDLDTIIGMKIPAERKRQLVIDHLANYGLNVEQLMKYGQLGGIG